MIPNRRKEIKEALEKKNKKLHYVRERGPGERYLESLEPGEVDWFHLEVDLIEKVWAESRKQAFIEMRSYANLNLKEKDRAYKE